MIISSKVHHSSNNILPFFRLTCAHLSAHNILFSPTYVEFVPAIGC